MLNGTSIDLKKLIDTQDWKELKKIMEHTLAADIVDDLLLASPHEQVLIFRLLSLDTSSEVFSLLELEQQDDLLQNLTNQETRQLLASLPPDDRTALIVEMPSPVTRRLMGLLNSEDLKEVRQLLGYPEESVGRVMTPDYVQVRSNWTMRQVLENIRFYGKDSETINYVYVVDESGYLLSSMRLRIILLADLDQLVSEVVEDNVELALSAFEDREEAVVLMKKYDVMALPVVDSKKVLIGIVTFDDVMDIAEEEATEDIQKAASISPLRDSYFRLGVLSLYQKRVTWLIILVILNIVTAGVIGIFDQNLATYTVLISFMPMMLGTGGNTGSQASTLIIRALTIGDLDYSRFWPTFFKEILLGMLLGVTLGVVASIISFLRVGISFKVPLVVALSMMTIVLSANLIGVVLPFVLSKLKVDPAVASGPLITTLIDALGLFIYFSFAMLIL